MGAIFCCSVDEVKASRRLNGFPLDTEKDDNDLSLPAETDNDSPVTTETDNDFELSTEMQNGFSESPETENEVIWSFEEEKDYKESSENTPSTKTWSWGFLNKYIS